MPSTKFESFEHLGIRYCAIVRNAEYDVIITASNHEGKPLLMIDDMEMPASAFPLMKYPGADVAGAIKRFKASLEKP